MFENLIISKNITVIITNAFSSNQLVSLTIPNTMTSIGLSAFAFNKLIGNLNIPSSVKTIDNIAFHSNLLISLTIENAADKVTFVANSFTLNGSLGKESLDPNFQP